MIEKWRGCCSLVHVHDQPARRVKRFDEKALGDIVQNFTILMNVAAFYELFAQRNESGQGSTHVLDRWILARLNKLVVDTTDRLKYIITETVRDLGAFIDDLSTWYVRRSRDRMKGRCCGSTVAIETLRQCLFTLSKLMAPFAPFLLSLSTSK